MKLKIGLLSLLLLGGAALWIPKGPALPPGLTFAQINNPGTGGSGTGTVTATGGALTANAVVLGAGTTDTKVSTGITSNGVSELDLGVNGASAGVLGMNGLTSGKATITAPAIAATTSNSFVFSNDIQSPGLNLADGVVTSITNGAYGSGGTNLNLVSSGALSVFMNATVVSPFKLFHYRGGNNPFVTGNFTTSGSGTGLENITGLTWALPATALNYTLHCALSYSQAVGAAAVAFGIKAATNAPTNIFANGVQQISAGPPATFVTGTLATLASTTATAIVSGTPGAQGVNYTVTLDGTIENPAAANALTIAVSTATAADLVTVLRGSYCTIE